MVAFVEVSEQEIEEAVEHRWMRLMDKAYLLWEWDDEKTVPPSVVKEMWKWITSDRCRAKLRKQNDRIRKHLRLDPTQRLRSLVDYWLPIAVECWHDYEPVEGDPVAVEDDDLQLLPFLCALSTLIEFGEVEQAFLHMRDHWEMCWSEDFDVTCEMWMDVKFPEEG